jgi:ribose transport system ATP-binding protein
MENQPRIRAEGISKRFPGVQALEDVEFEVYPGEVVGLVGENGAGKSTLVKILSGVYARDQGRIWFKGRLVDPRSPQEAQALGISTIYQEPAVIPGLSVAENVFLNREPRRIRALGMVDFGKMRLDTQASLSELGVDIRPGRLVRELTVAGQQMVEIAKAISWDATLLIMDEPTSSLSSSDAERLFEIVRRLKSRGVSVVFISHRIEEVLQVTDRIVVMRDGRRVGSLPISEATREKIVRLMVGRAVGIFPKVKVEIGEPVLEIRHLSGKGMVGGVSLSARKGEILGLAGLVGAGRTELARIICGVDERIGGQILLDGQEVDIRSPSDAVRLGIGLVPEDRKGQGLVLKMDVRENVTLAILRRLARWLGAISRREQREVAAHYVDALSIATPSLAQLVENLSGGNQQKVVLAKWLSAHPRVLIMDEPTRGIDVGAKAEVHALMSQLASEGIGILMISSELPEILSMSDRVIVMCQGRITGEFRPEETTQEEIISCATRFLTKEQLQMDVAPGVA